VKIKLRCTENSRCIGAVTLTTAKAVTARRKARKLRLASKRFNIPGGRVSTVTVRLSRKGRRLLARKHAFKVVVRVTGKDTAGNAGHTVTRTLTLKRPRAKKHRG
jgi:hypothetical protein